MTVFAHWLTSKLLWLAQFLPGNLLRAWLCTPKGFKYALPATLLVLPYAAFGYWLYTQIQAGDAPRWLLLVVVGCAISIYHFLVIGIHTLKARIAARIEVLHESRKAL